MIGVLEINGVKLDISESLFVPLNYAISDARNPEKRKRNTSQVIALPGTKRNKDFFFSAWNLGASDEKGDGVGFNFDPTIKYAARYFEKDQVIFDGTASLDTVDITAENETFNVILYSNVVDVFQNLGDLTLPELDWSAYSHTLSIANIVASWSAPVGSGYLYGLIDFGFTNDLLSYKTNELFAYVYHKEVWEKAFALSNLTIDSSFFDSDRFKRRVIGTGGGDKLLLSPAQIAQRRSDHTADGTISAVVASPTILPITPAIPLGAATYYKAFYTYNETVRLEDNDIITTALVNDPLSQYDSATGRLTVSNTGSYNLNVTGTFPFTYGFNGGTTTEEEFLVFLSFKIKRNGAIIKERRDVVIDQASPFDFIININQSLFLEASDVLEMEFEVVVSKAIAQVNDLADVPNSFDYSLDLNNDFEFNLTSTQLDIVDGNTVDISTFLPGMKISDLLNSDIKAFNLYVGEPNERGVVKIEPLNDFYKGTDEAKQMSDKVDYSKPMKIEPASGIEGKQYLFKFAEDRDHYKTLYFDQFGRDYGDYIYNVPSTFKKGQRVYELAYAQSVPVEIAGTEIIIPRIISFDPINEVSEPYKGKPRSFYYQGLIPLVSDTWDLVNSATLLPTTQTSYPRLHHLDDLTAPTFDFNFGRPEIVYYTATAYTSNSLFVAYHDQFLRELTGRDSKFLQLYMKLNENDLQGEFLRELWNIRGTIYRINKIREYNGNGDSTTWCELVRINKGKSPNTFVLPVTEVPNTAKSLTFRFEKSITDLGIGNTIDLQAKNILIQGSNNTIVGALENVSLINTSNATVTSSNSTAINGHFVYGNDSVLSTSSDINVSEEYSLYVIDSSGGDINVKMLNDTVVGMEWNFKKTKRQNDVDFTVNGGGTIDGSASFTLKKKNSNVTIKYIGGGEYIIT